MGTVRTLLAISVLITHSELILGRGLLSGDMAVTCFYILSGFLITLILKEKYASTKAFYINRALRIYVPYLAALIFSVIVFWAIQDRYHDPTHTYRQATESGSWLWVIWSSISNLTLAGIDLTRYIGVQNDNSIVFPGFLHNGLGSGHAMLFVPQAWTLALELQFYLLAPFIVRLRVHWLAALTLAFLLGRTVIFNRIRQNGLPIDDAAIFPMQLQYFLLGSLAFHGYRALRAWAAPERIKRGLSAAFTLLAVAMIFKGLDVLHNSLRSTYDLFYVLFAATVPFMFYLSKDWKWDSRIGEYSYPIYVFHYAVAALLWKHATAPWVGEAVLVITLAICTVYIHVIDRPVQRIRSRIARRQPGEAPDLSLTVPVTP